jgi:hypothetical protein
MRPFDACKQDYNPRETHDIIQNQACSSCSRSNINNSVVLTPTNRLHGGNVVDVYLAPQPPDAQGAGLKSATEEMLDLDCPGAPPPRRTLLVVSDGRVAGLNAPPFDEVADRLDEELKQELKNT